MFGKKKIIEYSDKEQVLQAVIRLLANREHSQAELVRKLAARCVVPHMLDNVIEQCIADGYQSDARYAQMIIRVRAEQSYGANRINQDLKLKGISSDIAKQAFEELDVDWFEVALQCFNRKYRRQYDASVRKSHDKCLRSMSARGFSFDQIHYAIEQPAPEFY